MLATHLLLTLLDDMLYLISVSSVQARGVGACCCEGLWDAIESGLESAHSVDDYQLPVPQGGKLRVVPSQITATCRAA